MSIKPGIIVCTRSDSTRIPNKPWAKVKDRYLISHLIDNLKLAHLPIVLATPEKDKLTYINRLERSGVEFAHGHEHSPLHRMLTAADLHKIDPIVRVTHDKIFIDEFALNDAMREFIRSDVDYLYSSNLIEGTGFEIISRDTLRAAANHFSDQNIEHISYAVRDVAKKIVNYKPPGGHYNHYLPDVRLLIDFQEDLEFIRSIFDYSNAKSPDLMDALGVLDRKSFLKKINRQPDITVYTCAHNEQDYIHWCMESVMSQTVAEKLEYIIIDDHSTDDTYKRIIESKHFGRIKLRRNESNIGLSSSSNIALNLARGKYILRLDADDALIFPFSLEKMLREAKINGYEALYPSLVDQASRSVLFGSDSHHAGGCLFETKAIRNIQFTEKLRGFEGLDLFHRAKDHLKIGYYNELPTFFYRDRPNSMSKTNQEYRDNIKRKLDTGITGHQLEMRSI